MQVDDKEYIDLYKTRKDRRFKRVDPGHAQGIIQGRHPLPSQPTNLSQGLSSRHHS